MTEKISPDERFGVDAEFEARVDKLVADRLKDTKSRPIDATPSSNQLSVEEKLRAGLRRIARGECTDARSEAARTLVTSGHETTALQRALQTIDAAGVLSDWINRARPVITDLMQVYERRIRTDCTPEQLAKEPWRCMEYVGAESLLRDQPKAVVELTLTEKASVQCPQCLQTGGFHLAICDRWQREVCEDCPPIGYPTDETRCAPCPRRSAQNGTVKP